MLNKLKYWWRNSESAVWLAFALGLVIFVAGFLLAVNGLASRDCRIYMQQTGRQTKFAWFTCYVKDTSGVWWAWEEWKLRNATKGE